MKAWIQLTCKVEDGKPSILLRERSRLNLRCSDSDSSPELATFKLDLRHADLSFTCFSAPVIYLL